MLFLAIPNDEEKQLRQKFWRGINEQLMTVSVPCRTTQILFSKFWKSLREWWHPTPPIFLVHRRVNSFCNIRCQLRAKLLKWYFDSKAYWCQNYNSLTISLSGSQQRNQHKFLATSCFHVSNHIWPGTEMFIAKVFTSSGWNTILRHHIVF